MKTIIHRADSRGTADYGWLRPHYSFSFSNYYNPDRMGFGALRVLNDDYIDAGKGFPTHPHRDMEIITIPLSGLLEHKDNMGNAGTISAGEIQIMSAGTGVFHSEYNKSEEDPLQLLQIWIIPNKEKVPPRYNQLSLETIQKKNELYNIVTPHKNDDGLWIYQDAWFSLANVDVGWEGDYHIKQKNNGVYLFVIEGSVDVNNESLNRRDAMGIWNTNSFKINASEDSFILLMDVPMN